MNTSSTGNSRKIKMQLVMLEAEQSPDFEHDELLGGAFINCYMKNRTPEQALNEAQNWVKGNGWNILKVKKQHQINKSSLKDSKDGLEYYDQTVIDGEVFVFHTWPLNSKD